MAINPYTRSRLPYDPSEIVPIALYGFLAAGKARTLTVVLDKRFSALPDVPTYKDAGMPGS